MKIENKRKQLLEINEKKFNELAKISEKVALYVRIALFTGLRYSSISNIRYCDVVAENGYFFIEINKMKYQNKSNLVNINQDLYNKIMATKGRKAADNYVISSNKPRTKLTIQFINRILNKVLNTTTHGLRYCFAIANKINGASIEMVCNGLFHKNINTTMTYLSHALTTMRLYGRDKLKKWLLQTKKYINFLETI